MATNPYRRTSTANRFKGDDPTATPADEAVEKAPGGISSVKDDELSLDELLSSEGLPEGVTDKTLWMAAKEQAEEEGKADDEEYVKSLYDEMEKTEKMEEEVGGDLDGDGEEGEAPTHVAIVLGKSKSEEEPPATGRNDVPSWVKDEKAWSEAKKRAAAEGHRENWAYVTSIYKKMAKEPPGDKKETEQRKPKSFFNLLGYGKRS